MEKDKTTGQPAKVKPEAVTEKQTVEVTEKLETQQDSGEKEETETDNDQSEAENSKPQTETEKLKATSDEIAPDIRAQQAKDAAFIAPYAKAYPKEKAFHVTSDKQVFLERDRGLAFIHQHSLQNGEKVQTIKVK